MALEEYEVEINGMTTTAQLSPEHAARLGARKVSADVDTKAEQPATKARKASNKAG